MVLPHGRKSSRWRGSARSESSVPAREKKTSPCRRKSKMKGRQEDLRSWTTPITRSPSDPAEKSENFTPVGKKFSHRLPSRRELAWAPERNKPLNYAKKKNSCSMEKQLSQSGLREKEAALRTWEGFLDEQPKGPHQFLQSSSKDEGKGGGPSIVEREAKREGSVFLMKVHTSSPP